MVFGRFESILAYPSISMLILVDPRLAMLMPNMLSISFVCLFCLFFCHTHKVTGTWITSARQASRVTCGRRGYHTVEQPTLPQSTVDGDACRPRMERTPPTRCPSSQCVPDTQHNTRTPHAVVTSIVISTHLPGLIPLGRCMVFACSITDSVFCVLVPRCLIMIL